MERAATLSKCDLVMARDEIARMPTTLNTQAEREGGTYVFKQEYVDALAAFLGNPTIETASALLAIAPALCKYFEECSR